MGNVLKFTSAHVEANLRNLVYGGSPRSGHSLCFEVADDYSDLIEKMEYYIAHPEEAESIIKNAHAWVGQFRDQKRERLISLLVAKKYFEKSGQM